MPNNLSEAQLKAWYKKFSQELREKANIDVKRVEDLGRIKNYPINHWNAEDDEADYGLVTLDEPTYAYMPHDGVKCRIPTPRDVPQETYNQWVKDNLQANISLDHIRTLYDMSRAGTLMISYPGEGMEGAKQVYTDIDGNITTSTSLKEAFEAAGGDSRDSNLPHWTGLPQEVPPADPEAHGLPPKPVMPVPPKNMKPGFLAWLGDLFGRETDYTRKARYLEEREAYPRLLQAWEDNARQSPNYPNYMEDVHAREQFEQAIEQHRTRPLAIQYAISGGYQQFMRKIGDEESDMDIDLEQTHRSLEQNVVKALEQEHYKTPLGNLTHGWRNIQSDMNRVKLPKAAINDLLGLSCHPHDLFDWVDRGVFKPDEIKLKTLKMPRFTLDLDPTLTNKENSQRREAWILESRFLGALASLSALTDPAIIGEPAKENFSAILKGLFTVGVPNSDSLVKHLDPAREIGTAALTDLLENNDAKSMSQLLGNGLRSLSQEVAGLPNLRDEHTRNTLYIMDQMLTIIDKRPALAENLGLSEQEMSQIRSDQQTYRVLSDSLQAKKNLVEHSLSRKTLSDQELRQAITDICFADLVTKLTAAGHRVSLSNPESLQAAKARVEQLSGAEKVIALDREGLGSLTLNSSNFHRAFAVKLDQFKEGLSNEPDKVESIVKSDDPVMLGMK